MSIVGENSLDGSVSWLRAAGEPTRLRLLALLSQIDLTVSELIAILDQSQPRISRHLKLLVDAGLAERFQEGAWAYFRTVSNGPARSFLDSLLQGLNPEDEALLEDKTKLEQVREKRSKRAADYFAENADHWNKIRSLHVPEDRVEEAMLSMGLAANPTSILDLGTGTGRILQLFSPSVSRGTGIDTSHGMLSVARAALSGKEHDKIQVRYGNVYRLGEGESYDLIVFHQVLHFLEDPALALFHAKRRLSVGGRLLIVDFAPHEFDFLRDEHAHFRLGMSTEQIKSWFAAAGLALLEEKVLTPDDDAETALTVALWVAGNKTD